MKLSVMCIVVLSEESVFVVAGECLSPSGFVILLIGTTYSVVGVAVSFTVGQDCKCLSFLQDSY